MNNKNTETEFEKRRSAEIAAAEAAGEDVWITPAEVERQMVGRLTPYDPDESKRE